MRRILIFILILTLPAIFAAQQLSVDDRLLVRESQLTLAQAHIQMAQSQANVAKAELSLTQLVLSLKEKYGCKGQCALDENLSFVAPKGAAMPAVASEPAVPGEVPDNQKERKGQEKPK